MQWDKEGYCHWVSKEFEGFEIHMKAVKKANQKLLDAKHITYVLDSETKKVLKRFEKQPHMVEQSEEAVAWVKSKMPEPEPVPEPEPIPEPEPDPFDNIPEFSQEDH